MYKKMNKFLTNFLRIVFIVACLFSLTTFSSCKKNDAELKIFGTIYDVKQNNPMSGVKIILSGKSISGGVYTPFYKDIGSFTTDANGKFEFKFKNEKSESYRISVIKENYFSQLIEISGKELEVKPSYEKNFNLRSAGYIQLNVKNIYPDSETDEIIYYFSNASEDCEDCCSNVPYKGKGPLYDTTFTCKFFGDEYARIFYSVTKDNKTFVYFDSIWCSAFNTVNHNIQY